MTVHHFTPTDYHTAMGPFPPVLRVEPGDTIVTTTVDASGCDASGQRVTPGGNPQTGPFYVNGAEPGDTLVVHFDRLTPNRATGFSRTQIAPLTLDRQAHNAQQADVRGEWAIDLNHSETDDHIFTVGNARPLDAATRHATTEMRRWLLADYSLDERGAALLMGMCVTTPHA